MAGPGQVTVDPPGAGVRRIRVWNFDTSHVELKPEHGPGMERLLMPLLRGRRPPPFVHLIGLASRRGSFGQNQRLSQGRVENVRAAVVGMLRREREPVPLNGLSSFVAMGELTALLAGRPEGDNADTDRAVLIEISDSPEPTIVRPTPGVPTTNIRLRRLPVPDDRDPIVLRSFSKFFAVRVEVMAGASFGPPGLPLSADVSAAGLTFWDTENMLIAQYMFAGGGRGAQISIIPIPGSVNFVGDWNCFNMAGPMRVEDFGGSAKFTRTTVALGENVKFTMNGSVVIAANRGRPKSIDPFVVGDGVGSFDLVGVQELEGFLIFNSILGVRSFTDDRRVLLPSGLAPTCRARAGHMRRVGGRAVRAG